MQLDSSRFLLPFQNTFLSANVSFVTKYPTSFHSKQSQVYTVAGGKNIPGWLSDKKKKSLKSDEEYQRRVELIQDFEFPAACQRIKFTNDGQYIFATGYHPPRVRVYDTSQLSMKFERHLDSEIVDFQILTDDYSKAVFLCADRSLNFHAKFGAYYKVRVPKFGRDLAYCPFTAEVLVASSSPEVYRLSLAEGRFLSPLISKSPAVNVCGIAPAHGLLACAGEDGGLECFDLRQRDSLGWLDAAAAAGGRGQSLTACRFDNSGMHVAVGTSGGLVALFDLRSQRPLVIKDHMYDSKIVDIKFHSGGFGGANGGGGGLGGDIGRQRVISADKHIIKIWDASTGEGYTNIEPSEGCDINDVAIQKDSGLVVAACDASRIQAYFIPSLGPAPRWCSFLESLTEELEESTNPTVYDDYRFITRTDLEKLGLTHLVGTPMLRAYMHGFFIDNRLYHKAKAIVDPFAYDTYRQKRIAQKMEEERKSRISLTKKLPKVNATMAARILVEQHQEEQAQALAAAKDTGDTKLPGLEDDTGINTTGLLTAAERKRKKNAAAGMSLLEDDRFKVMFEDPEFAIDERSADYKALHPNVDPAKDRELLAEHFEELGSSDDDDQYSEEDDEEDAQRKPVRHDKRLKTSDDGDAGTGRQPRMFAAKDDVAAAAFREGRSLAPQQEMPLGARTAALGDSGGYKPRLGGSREMSYTPRRSFGGGGDRGGGHFGGGGGGRFSGGDRGGRGDRGRGGGGGRGSGGRSDRGGGRGGGRGRGHSPGGRGGGRGRGGGGGGGRGRGGGGGGGRGGGRGRGRS
jgi:ribosome biogenesis protein ENP2